MREKPWTMRRTPRRLRCCGLSQVCSCGCTCSGEHTTRGRAREGKGGFGLHQCAAHTVTGGRTWTCRKRHCALMVQAGPRAQQAVSSEQEEPQSRGKRSKAARRWALAAPSPTPRASAQRGRAPSLEDAGGRAGSGVVLGIGGATARIAPSLKSIWLAFLCHRGGHPLRNHREQVQKPRGNH